MRSAAALAVISALAACDYAAAADNSDRGGSARAAASAPANDEQGSNGRGEGRGEGSQDRGGDGRQDDGADRGDGRGDDRGDDRGDRDAAQPGAGDRGGQDGRSGEPPADRDQGAGAGNGQAPPPGDDDRDGEQAPPPGDDGKGERDGAPQAPPAGGLDVLATDCSNSRLEPHNGFQEAPRCVDTSFGEVTSADKSPSLLITSAPDTARVNEPFDLQVSTRNLVRDRFLGAAAGGYYLESSVLDGQGIQRGHFHTACRMLPSTDVAPDAAPEPEFFVATQDGGGGAGADTVTVTVTGMPTAGEAQCSVWAGDGSHRIPMMQRADQTPAFDSVRVTVQ
ncbi:hypothetical protein [Pseudonocardia sp. H11422]|uniref:hypothetical protein n=1 Tax=Pseudonocardia sp. H11422 TaxID=2835866 RepID=UPI001BDD9BDE|nr:hypothetical protein [Pseudonocardia sp. H11422]